MSREIKFRGMTDEGEWVYGCPVKCFWYGCESVSIGGAFYGSDFDGEPVNQETIGEFTGIKDKNGVEVYEGDVVKVDDDGDCYLSDVYFDGGALCISVEHCDFDYTAIGWVIGSQCGIESIEVIGNIHENPDLLKESEK